MVDLTLLWLDDIRNPFEHNWLRYSPIDITNLNVIWVKTFNEFIDYINVNGLPTAICFDHDLGEADERTGYDCAKWLVDYCTDNNLDLPKYNIQSANPVGKSNINGIFISYNKFKNNNVTFNKKNL